MCTYNNQHGNCHCRNSSFGSKHGEKAREGILVLGLLLWYSVELLLYIITLVIIMMGRKWLSIYLLVLIWFIFVVVGLHRCAVARHGDVLLFMSPCVVRVLGFLAKSSDRLSCSGEVVPKRSPAKTRLEATHPPCHGNKFRHYGTIRTSHVYIFVTLIIIHINMYRTATL
mgnify:CR=1 FL=1